MHARGDRSSSDAQDELRMSEKRGSGHGLCASTEVRPLSATRLTVLGLRTLIP